MPGSSPASAEFFRRAGLVPLVVRALVIGKLRRDDQHPELRLTSRPATYKGFCEELRALISLFATFSHTVKSHADRLNFVTLISMPCCRTSFRIIRISIPQRLM
jgi:hypothetical protein